MNIRYVALTFVYPSLFPSITEKRDQIFCDDKCLSRKSSIFVTSFMDGHKFETTTLWTFKRTFVPNTNEKPWSNKVAFYGQQFRPLCCCWRPWIEWSNNFNRILKVKKNKSFKSKYSQQSYNIFWLARPWIVQLSCLSFCPSLLALFVSLSVCLFASLFLSL